MRKHKWLYHVGSSCMMYASLVTWRSCHEFDGPASFDHFHPYAFLWVVGFGFVSWVLWDHIK